MYVLKVFILFSLIFFAFGASEKPFTILDASEYERRLPKVRYHLYDPQLFLMYTECLPVLRRPCYSTRSKNEYFHGLDMNFVEAIIALNQSVPPSEADLFIIPVFYNQAYLWNMPCHTLPGGPSRLIDQMFKVLHSQGNYIAGMRNHFLMADHYASGFTQHWDSFTYPLELIVGRYEVPTACYSLYRTEVKDMSQFMNVGYATKNGIYANCPYHDSTRSMDISSFKSIHNRKYLMSFTGGVYYKEGESKNYDNRNLLLDYVNAHNSTPDDIYISIYKKWLPISETNPRVKASDILQDSLISLFMRGDTPTTDRLWVAFEHLTLIGELSTEKEELLPLLPFPHRVPWEEIIVWIDFDAFVTNPFEAMRSTALGLDSNERERRYNLMLKHRRDVLWAYNESVAVLNVLEEAASHIKVL